MIAVTGGRNFSAGWHSIEVDYFQAGGTAGLTLSWMPPNATAYTVSTKQCYVVEFRSHKAHATIWWANVSKHHEAA